jgi:hypothetical protein
VLRKILCADELRERPQKILTVLGRPAMASPDFEKGTGNPQKNSP